MWFLNKPKTPEALYNNALDVYHAGDYKKALKVFEKIQDIKPTWSAPFYMAGLCYQNLRGTDQAKKAYQTALIHNPDDPDALYNLARLFYEADDLDIAAAYAEQADLLYLDAQGDALTCVLLGHIYEQQNRIPEAIEAYEKALSHQQPGQVEVLTYLAVLYSGQQNYERASALYETLLTFEPNNALFHYELAQCLSKLGEWEGTILHCQQVIELEPDNKQAHNQWGLALYCIGHLPEAVDHYQAALTLDPHYDTALNNLAYAYEKMGAYDDAIAHFTKYLTYTQANPAENEEIQEHIKLLRQKKNV